MNNSRSLGTSHQGRLLIDKHMHSDFSLQCDELKILIYLSTHTIEANTIWLPCLEEGKSTCWTSNCKEENLASSLQIRPEQSYALEQEKSESRNLVLSDICSSWVAARIGSTTEQRKFPLSVNSIALGLLFEKPVSFLTALSHKQFLLWKGAKSTSMEVFLPRGENVTPFNYVTPCKYQSFFTHRSALQHQLLKIPS